MGREDGVAILAEGITDKLDEHELNNLNDVSRDGERHADQNPGQ